jgi:hypothetical protein
LVSVNLSVFWSYSTTWLRERILSKPPGWYQTVLYLFKSPTRSATEVPDMLWIVRQHVVDRQHGVGTSGVGEKVVVDEHVNVRLVIKQQTLGILCGHRDASRVECDTGLVRFGPRLSAAVVAIGSLRVAGAVLSVLRASGLVG